VGGTNEIENSEYHESAATFKERGNAVARVFSVKNYAANHGRLPQASQRRKRELQRGDLGGRNRANRKRKRNCIDERRKVTAAKILMHPELGRWTKRKITQVRLRFAGGTDRGLKNLS